MNVKKQPTNERIKALQKQELKYNPNLMMDRVRMFDAKNPIASKAIAVTGIVATSAVVGAILGYAVDALAHLTNRKNDKVGIVFGTVMTLLLATTHTGLLFGLPQRFARRYRFGDFNLDSKSSAGQARQLMVDNVLPLWKAFERNAEANLGVQHSHLVVNEADIRKTINYIQRMGIPKEEWRAYLVEVGPHPIPNVACFKTAHAAPHVEIKANTYYTSSYRTVQDLLQRDWNHVFDTTHIRTDRFLESLAKQLKNDMTDKAKESTVASRLSLESNAEPTKTEIALSKQKLESAFEDFVTKSKPEAAKDMTKQFTYFEDDEIVQLQNFIRGLGKAEENKTVVYRPALDLEMSSPNKLLYTKLMGVVRNVFQDKNTDARTWVRIDELTKPSPGTLIGLRPATIHTALRNLGDSVAMGASTSSNPEMQARSTGATVGMYVPLMLLGSVISVLGLGISSTSGAASAPGGVAESGTAKGNSQPQQFSGSISEMGMSESAVHSTAHSLSNLDKTQQQMQQQQYANAPQPAFLQAVNYAPSAFAVTG